MGSLVYFSSKSGNTARFVERLGMPAHRIPMKASEPMPEPDEPYVLICPTYADGEGRGAVAKQVIRFLNDEKRRANLKGVIGSGNRNFGHLFGSAGDVISKKCDVPMLFKFELAGTETDVATVRHGLEKFWSQTC
jgi:ribonucleoside-diphosphate reductase 2, operon protein nrdI